MAKSAQIARIQARLDAIPIAVRKAAQASLIKSGNEVADTMRTLAESSRDTSALIDSIEVTPGGQSTPAYSTPGGEHVVPENAVAVTAGNHAVRYAHLVEFGTSEAKAQPFFWPAYRLLIKRIRNRTARDIRKAAREAVSK